MDEFDLDAFDQSYVEESETAEVVVEVDEQGILDDSVEAGDAEYIDDGQDDLEDGDELTVETTPDVESTINDPDAEKRNATFAAMRRERDEAKQQAAFLQKLADENGMSVEDLVHRYENGKLEEQAEEQGVPLEILQQLNSQKQELDNLKYQSFSTKFNAEVEATIEKYKASEEDVEATFAYAQQNGLTDSIKSGITSFEAVHKMAHMDALIEKQVQSALQNSLTQKKKRQQEAPVGHVAGATVTASSLEDQAVADAKAIMLDW